jgi:oligoribonuclease NrnB/cAMP/cGMP phosphodiesterase (DHH superfamily)
MIAIIHHNDHDGFCSGAIVAKYEKNQDKEFYCSTYNTNIIEELKQKKYNKIYIVDLSFDKDTMLKLKDITEKLIWIDHHQSAIENLKGLDFEGKRKIGKAGCRLTWEYLFEDKKIPYGVSLIDRFDVFDQSKKDFWDNYIYPFKIGMECHDMQPETNMGLWNKIFNNNQKFLKDTINNGKTINEYLLQMNKKLFKENGFEITFEDKKAVVINSLIKGSQLFESVYDKKIHDIMMVFAFAKNIYTVSIYTEKNDIDVSKIANKYGGGGHKQAAGFTCKKLPFDLPK